MDALLASWREEEQEPFIGWDFSYLDGRMHEEQAPWSYTTRAKELMRQTSSVLDTDTGGGERLLEMRDAWPETVVVTEAYPPNVKLARERLEPLGVRVIDVALREDRPFPFGDAEFGLFINRHGPINIDEVARILAPGGMFLTQQVHGMWAHDLLACFDTTPQWPEATPARYLPWLESAGMEIVMHEDWSGELAFADVGAIVYYLKAVPWMVPGFTVEKYQDELMKLQQQLEEQGRLVFTAKKYIIEARKPQ